MDTVGGMLSKNAGYNRLVKFKKRNRLHGDGQCENVAFTSWILVLLGWLDDLEGSNVKVELLGRNAQR